MSEPQPLATHDFESLPDALVFLKRTRFELRMLRMTRVFPDKVQVFDINGDFFEIRGLGYPDANVVPILQAVNTAFKTETIHNETQQEFKEFKTGRRYAWAADRVM